MRGWGIAFGAVFALCGWAAGGMLDMTVRFAIDEDARSGSGTPWRYTTLDPGSLDWTKPAFADGAWESGVGGFGSADIPHSLPKTPWATPAIRMRKTFSIPPYPVWSLVISIHHDDEALLYLNGQRIDSLGGFANEYKERWIADDYVPLLKPEGNVLGVLCRNLGGPGYVDAGIYVDVRTLGEPLITDAGMKPWNWNYTTADPGSEWAKPGFDDKAWAKGLGGFGTGGWYQPKTQWKVGDLWMRSAFTVDTLADFYRFKAWHDDGFEAYVNGVLIWRKAGSSPVYEDRVLSAEAAKAIHPGVNVLAVHTHDATTGWQFIDVGFDALRKPPPSQPTRLPFRGKAQGRTAPVLHAGPGGLDLSPLPGGLPGRMTVFGTDGRVRARVQGRSITGYLPLPVTLGTGVFRYRWDYPGGTLQGTLLPVP